MGELCPQKYWRLTLFSLWASYFLTKSCISFIFCICSCNSSADGMWKCPTAHLNYFVAYSQTRGGECMQEKPLEIRAGFSSQLWPLPCEKRQASHQLWEIHLTFISFNQWETGKNPPVHSLWGLNKIAYTCFLVKYVIDDILSRLASFDAAATNSITTSVTVITTVVSAAGAISVTNISYHLLGHLQCAKKW